MKKYMILALILLVNVTPSYAIWPFDELEQDFQYDADTIRAKHLKYYSELIEEYKKATGSYPFMEDAEIPIYVFIATKEQLPKGHPDQTAPYRHRIGTLTYFFGLLEKGLGRPVDEFYDPQKVSNTQRPNYYIYMANRGTYFFAVHFHNKFPFTTEVATNYNKIETSNNPTAENKAKNPDILFKNTEFIELLKRPLKKPGFVEEREHETIKASKGY